MNTAYLTKEQEQLRLSKRAFLMSVVALASILVFPVFLPAAMGSTAIVFAVLSKGADQKLMPQAKRAVLAGSLAIAISIGILVGSVVIFITALNDPVLREQLSETMYRMYGYTLDEFLQGLGISP